MIKHDTRKGRFIILIIDGFGIGAMEDCEEVRPLDVGANTYCSVMEFDTAKRFPNLEKLGLANAAGKECGAVRFAKDACFGRSRLSHYWCDSYWGHQELMGSKPLQPMEAPFAFVIEEIYEMLTNQGYNVNYLERENAEGKTFKLLEVNGGAVIGDNLEADLGQNYNITASFDVMPFEDLIKLACLVRGETRVARIIAFGAPDVPMEDIYDNIEIHGDYVGVNAPKCGVYKEGYLVKHLGYGIDPMDQIPVRIYKAGYPVSFIGKVADIVDNPKGKNISVVDSEQTLKFALECLKAQDEGFICINVQESDLAGHQQNQEFFSRVVGIADLYIGKIIDCLNDEDVFIVSADHGNDPSAGHSHHTREKVPVLIYQNDAKQGLCEIEELSTLADMGATVAKYFNAELPAYGTPIRMLEDQFEKKQKEIAV